MSANAELALSRRGFLASTAAAAGALALPGSAFAQASGDVVQRLLALATQTAFARLAQPEGFWNSTVARIGMPVLFRKSPANSAGPLGQDSFRGNLLYRINIVAESGARGASPTVMEAARKVVVTDPLTILRGAPTAATTHFRLAMGSGLVNALMLPLERALIAVPDPVITQAAALLAGVKMGDVAHAIALSADNGIWYEIGRSEAEIRANPAATNDPVLISGLARTPVPATSPAP